MKLDMGKKTKDLQIRIHAAGVTDLAREEGCVDDRYPGKRSST